MTRRSSHGDSGGLFKALCRRNFLQIFLAVCLTGVVLLYFEMYKMSSLMTTVENAKLSENIRRPVSDTTSVRVPADDSAAPSIAILLTHYLDSAECATTLTSIYTQAKFPAKLHVYLFEDVDVDPVNEQETTCLRLLCVNAPDICDAHAATRIHHKRRHASDYNGPGPARSIVEGMMPRNHGHEYYLSITTRLEFTSQWDETLVSQWTSIDNPRAILSLAPPSARTKAWPVDLSTQAILCTGHITAKRANVALIAFNPPVLVKEPRGPLPRLVSQYSENFHFGPARALAAAPSDPKVEFVWDGLAYYRATRWWTRGYDFYAPVVDVVFEHYTPRPTHPVQKAFWGDASLHGAERTRQQNSLFRVRRVLQFNMGEPAAKEDAKFSVGPARTLDQWVVFSGLDHRAEFDVSTDKQFQNCGPLVRVA
ncbi:Aste57867_18391 [Aphanomyces stellatus]|uniref:Aste57867_18391 protein n=1 Tax=Aphanomyces stellatus TaxID=120398 RepID=A0A485LBQ6_9STRA|nr:hypothetical protein As57867_018329 [Aphanomyces stellatus]VFT95127.1 Aste57867_18391 [Aphanomyces stellatus]